MKQVEKFLSPEETIKKGAFGIRLFKADGDSWNCPNDVLLYAPHDFYSFSENLILELTGGCGPGSTWDYLVPDTIWGLRITRACRIHNFMYSEVCTANQSTSDRVFINNMRRLVMYGTTFKPLRKPRLVRAKTYYLFVKYGGKSSVSDKK